MRLGDCFHGRPVLLTLVYYKCPMLCTVTLNQLSRSLNVLSESAGEQFDVVTVSFDPQRNTRTGRREEAHLPALVSATPAEHGWHFLTGSQRAIDALARPIGFHYTWDDAAPAVRPRQRRDRPVAEREDQPLFPWRRLSADGASPCDERGVERRRSGRECREILLYCFHYDPATGKYGLIISRAIQVARLAHAFRAGRGDPA